MEHGDRKRVACLSSAPWNPYLRLLYESVATAGVDVTFDIRPTLGWLWRSRRVVRILHVHWPEGLYRLRRGPARLRAPLSWVKLVVLALRLTAARLLGYRLVWTVHQVLPHETTSRRLDRAGAHLLASFASALIVHDRATLAATQRELGRRRRVAVIPHGSYRGVYASSNSRADVARRLAIPEGAFVFLAFGELRRYKGLDALLGAFEALPNRNAILIVAGNAKDPTAAPALAAAAQRDRRVRVRLGFVADDEVAELFDVCDVAVLARADGGTSGSLILALSLGKAVIAADTPAYRDLTGGRAGWLFDPGDPNGLRDALAAAADDRGEAARRGRIAQQIAADLEWGPIGQLTAQLFAAL